MPRSKIYALVRNRCTQKLTLTWRVMLKTIDWICRRLMITASLFQTRPSRKASRCQDVLSAPADRMNEGSPFVSLVRLQPNQRWALRAGPGSHFCWSPSISGSFPVDVKSRTGDRSCKAWTMSARSATSDANSLVEADQYFDDCRICVAWCQDWMLMLDIGGLGPRQTQSSPGRVRPSLGCRKGQMAWRSFVVRLRKPNPKRQALAVSASSSCCSGRAMHSRFPERLPNLSRHRVDTAARHDGFEGPKYVAVQRS
jgi:hypothetical protein